MNLGLSLSGGGIKGVSHIGVLKALEEENIHIDYISGTSSGSIVASLYAMGYSPEEMYLIFKKWAKKIKYASFFNIIALIAGLLFKQKIIITGLNNGKSLEKLINAYAKNKNILNINEINIPLIIPSVDLDDGSIFVFSSKEVRNSYSYSDEIHYINNINIATAVRSSCAFPGVFSPCIFNDHRLIDGGIRENIPWKEIKKLGAEKVISVVFETKLNYKKHKNIVDIVSSSIDILSHELSSYELSGADYLIQIKTPDIGLLDYKKIDYLFEEGYKQGKLKIQEIKNQII